MLLIRTKNIQDGHSRDNLKISPSGSSFQQAAALANTWTGECVRRVWIFNAIRIFLEIDLETPLIDASNRLVSNLVRIPSAHAPLNSFI